jgi:hypothetical protein
MKSSKMKKLHKTRPIKKQKREKRTYSHQLKKIISELYNFVLSCPKLSDNLFRSEEIKQKITDENPAPGPKAQGRPDRARRISIGFPVSFRYLRWIFSAVVIRAVASRDSFFPVPPTGAVYKNPIPSRVTSAQIQSSTLYDLAEEKSPTRSKRRLSPPPPPLKVRVFPIPPSPPLRVRRSLVAGSAVDRFLSIQLDCLVV